MNRSFFWEKIADRYSRQPVADEAAYQKKLQVTREYFRPDMEVLEFGCGTGSTAIAHAPCVKHIQAIDISSKMIEIARRKADAESVNNVTFEQSTLDDFSAPAGGYDAVLALSVLHLLENREASIARIYEMLRPGGLFVSSTACVGDSMKYLRFVAPIGRPFGLVLKVFSRAELEESLTGAGFELDYQWQPPGKGKSVFIVAKKAAQNG